MRADYLFLAAVCLLSVLVVGIYGLSTLPRQSNINQTNSATTQLTPLKEPTATFVNPSFGPTDAPVRLIIFGDYLCDACAQLNEVVRQIATERPTQVRLIWKDMPITDRSKSKAAAIAGRCAAMQGKFWEYHDLLMFNRTAAVSENLPIVAGQVGLDVVAFEECLNSEVTAPLVERDFEEGVRLNLDAVPYLFINGRRFSGAVNADLLKTVIDDATRTATAPSL